MAHFCSYRRRTEDPSNRAGPAAHGAGPQAWRGVEGRARWRRPASAAGPPVPSTGLGCRPVRAGRPARHPRSDRGAVVVPLTPGRGCHLRHSHCPTDGQLPCGSGRGRSPPRRPHQYRRPADHPAAPDCDVGPAAEAAITASYWSCSAIPVLARATCSSHAAPPPRSKAAGSVASPPPPWSTSSPKAADRKTLTQVLVCYSRLDLPCLDELGQSASPRRADSK